MTTLDTHDEILGWDENNRVIIAASPRTLIYIGDGREYTLYFRHYALSCFMNKRFMQLQKSKCCSAMETYDENGTLYCKACFKPSKPSYH